MTIRINHLTDAHGEHRREFHLIARVTFRGGVTPEENYYSDSELPGRVEDWVDAALNDRDDSPSLTFHEVPAILEPDVRAVVGGTYPDNAEAVATLLALAEEVDRVHRVDYERAHGVEDTLMRTALEMIRDGAGDPVALARIALQTQGLKFERVSA